jgi:hypothetical protein
MMLRVYVSQAALGEILELGAVPRLAGIGGKGTEPRKSRNPISSPTSRDPLDFSSHTSVTGCGAGLGNGWTAFELEEVIGSR